MTLARTRGASAARAELDVLERHAAEATWSQLAAKEVAVAVAYVRARLAVAEGNWAEAVKELRWATEAEPNFAAAHEALAGAYLALRQAPFAEYHADMALRLTAPDIPRLDDHLDHLLQLAVTPIRPGSASRAHHDATAEVRQREPSTAPSTARRSAADPLLELLDQRLRGRVARAQTHRPLVVREEMLAALGPHELVPAHELTSKVELNPVLARACKQPPVAFGDVVQGARSCRPAPRSSPQAPARAGAARRAATGRGSDQSARKPSRPLPTGPACVQAMLTSHDRPPGLAKLSRRPFSSNSSRCRFRDRRWRRHTGGTGWSRSRHPDQQCRGRVASDSAPIPASK